jgi:Asp-tRNA(Asn)/Glu-tRNA(Gln) amidotransferase A subunit family amidase
VARPRELRGSTERRIARRHGWSLAVHVYAPFTAMFNISGQPAISLPLAWSDGDLPVGVQLVGRYGDEATLLRLASQLEQIFPWARASRRSRSADAPAAASGLDDGNRVA